MAGSGKVSPAVGAAGAHDPWQIGRRRAQLLLGLTLAFFAAWDLRAVLLDNRLGPTDTTLEETLGLLTMWEQAGWRGLFEWWAAARKGPLAGVLGALVTPLVGDPLRAARILGVLLGPVTAWAVWRVALRLGAGHGAALLAVLLGCGFPGHVGWVRMDSHEALQVPATALTVLLLLGPLRRPAEALGLGLAGGLGTLAKVGYGVFILPAGLVFVAGRVRSRQSAALVALALVVALLITVGWMVPNRAHLAEYVDGSSMAEVFTWGEKLRAYIHDIPGTPALLGAGLLGALLAGLGGACSRFGLALVGAAAYGGTAILVYFFDSWARYLTPAFPLAGLLAALGLWQVARWLAPRGVGSGRCWGARLLGGGAAAATLALYVTVNISGVPWPDGRREWGAGMVAPDSRSYGAYPALVQLSRQRGYPVLRVLGWPMEQDLVPQDMAHLWVWRGFRPDELTGEEAKERLRRGLPLYILLQHADDPAVAALFRNHPVEQYDAELQAMVAARPKRVVQTYQNPDGKSFSLVEVGP